MEPNETPIDSSRLKSDLEDLSAWLPVADVRRVGKFLQFDNVVATLRFFGEDLDPDELTKLLRCEPTATHHIGDPITKGSSGRQRKSSWRLESRIERACGINDHVSDLLSRLSDDLAVWRDLARFRPDMFFGLFLSSGNQADEVSPRILGMLAVRGISLSLDVYQN